MQSAENVQLWSMIGELQGELADYKGRLSKLEAEISSLRSAATDEPAVEVGNGSITVRGQPTKRGRSKRAIAPVGSQPPLQARTRGRKRAIARTKVEEAKPTFLGKDSLNKVDDKHKDFTSFDITEQEKNGISPAINQNNGIMEIDDGTLKMPASEDNQVIQQCPESQSRGIEFKPASLLKSNYEGNQSSKNTCLILSQDTKGSSTIAMSVILIHVKKKFIWSLGIISQDSEQNDFSIASPSIYTNGNVSRQGITRWNFKHEDEAAELGFPAVGHKRENEEMADEFSSGPEEIETQNGSSWC